MSLAFDMTIYTVQKQVIMRIFSTQIGHAFRGKTIHKPEKQTGRVFPERPQEGR
jgi:hypothetical protein